MRPAFTGRSVVRQGVLTRVGLGLAACGLTALVYLPAVDYPFVLDDRMTVLLNPSLVDLRDWRGIVLYDRWHPLVNVSFAIDRAFSGISPFGFHITSGVLHILVVALLFALATRLRPGSDRGQTGARPGPDRGQTGVRPGSDPGLTPGRTWAAFVAAAAFGANPLTARSVVYVSARADVLFTCIALLAVMLAWGAARARSTPRAVIAGVVAALALTAIPIASAAPHGPMRLYVSAAIAAFAAAWWSPPIFARWRAARVAGVLVVAALLFA